MPVIINGTTGIDSPAAALTTPLPVTSGGTGASSLSGITTGTSTNLAGGFAGNVPYQSAPGTTGMVAAGSSGQALLSNGASAPTWGTPATATTATNLAGGSNGTIPYQSASGTTQMLAVGSAGQLLQTNGAGAPSWVTASSGALVYISTVTASSSATVSVSLGSTYENYLLVANGVTSSTTQVILQMQFGGITANYKFKVMTISSDDNTFYGSGASSQTKLSLSYSSAASGTTSSMNFSMRIPNPSNTTFMKSVWWDGVNVANRVETMLGVGSNTSTGALTSLVFSYESGNISAGTFRLYGIANS